MLCSLVGASLGHVGAVKNRPIIRLVLGLCLFASGVTGLIYLFAFAEQVPQELFIPAGLATLIGIAVVLSDPPPKVQKKKRESDWKDTGGKVVRALGWLWLVAVNIFYVLVVLYVFARLTGRTEHILVSILGLIYVAIRGQSLGLAMTLPSTFLAIHREFVRIRALLREKSVPTPTRELDDDEFLEDISRHRKKDREAILEARRGRPAPFCCRPHLHLPAIYSFVRIRRRARAALGAAGPRKPRGDRNLCLFAGDYRR